MVMNASGDEETEDESANQHFVERMQKIREGIYKKAEMNIKSSQKQTKEDCDKKHCLMRVSMCILC